MSAIASALNASRDNLLIPFFSALVVAFFLFFIDEGYYDLRWMLNWGNWIVFVMYIALLFPIQWGICYVLFRNMQRRQKALMMFALGIPITLALFWVIVL